MATTRDITCFNCGGKVSYGTNLALIQVDAQDPTQEPHCMLCLIRTLVHAKELLILG